MTTEALFGKLFSDEIGEGADSTRTWKFGVLRRAYPVALLAFDILLITLIYMAATYVRRVVIEGEPLQHVHISKRALTVLLAGCISGIALIGGYLFSAKTNSSRFFSEHIVASVITAVLVSAAIYGFIAYGAKVKAARSAVFVTLAIFPVISISYRYVLGGIKERRQARRAICILGNGPMAETVVNLLRDHHWRHDVWIFDSRAPAGTPISHPRENVYVAPLSEFEAGRASINERSIHHIILAMNPQDLELETFKTLVQSHSRNQHVEDIESFVLKNFRCVPVEMVGPSWGFGEGFRIQSSFTYNRAKRAIDILSALAGLLLISPLMIATAIAVKLTSRGPVLFRQERTGMHERPFTMLKFRTMREGAEKLGDYTEEEDPRLTSIGGFLRRSRLDELPQLINVLRGDMSLIGPRAEWTKLTEKYENDISLYHYRHMVRPGVTGWAQVNYSYGSGVEDTVEKLKYDLYYVRYFSFILDLTIVVKTVYTMLFGKGR